MMTSSALRRPLCALLLRCVGFHLTTAVQLASLPAKNMIRPREARFQLVSPPQSTNHTLAQQSPAILASARVTSANLDRVVTARMQTEAQVHAGKKTNNRTQLSKEVESLKAQSQEDRLDIMALQEQQKKIIDTLLERGLFTPEPTSSPTPFTGATPSPTPPATMPTSSQSASPTDSPSPTEGPAVDSGSASCGTCVIWGDPHIITFAANRKRMLQHPLRAQFFRTHDWKSDQLTISRSGVFWLVKNEDVEIQAYFNRDTRENKTELGRISITGRFVDSNLLVIRPLNSESTWNGEPILNSSPSVFKNRFVDALCNTGMTMVKDGSRGPGIELTLPGGVHILANRWRNSLAAEITMCPGPTAEQTGLCSTSVGRKLHADTY